MINAVSNTFENLKKEKITYGFCYRISVPFCFQLAENKYTCNHNMAKVSIKWHFNFYAEDQLCRVHVFPLPLSCCLWLRATEAAEAIGHRDLGHLLHRLRVRLCKKGFLGYLGKFIEYCRIEELLPVILLGVRNIVCDRNSVSGTETDTEFRYRSRNFFSLSKLFVLCTSYLIQTWLKCN